MDVLTDLSVFFFFSNENVANQNKKYIISRSRDGRNKKDDRGKKKTKKVL
jgi:hypothetical protein